MSGCLYFPNNLKDIEDHIQAYKISYKIFFQLMVTVFKENLNLQLPLIFCSSIRFVFETVFISEQIVENMFEALLEISDKFITKFNVFSYMVLLKTVWKISKPYCDFTVARQFCLKGNILYHKSQECIVSPPPPPSLPYKVYENSFCKNALHGGTNVLGQIYGGCFTWGLIIRSCKWGS